MDPEHPAKRNGVEVAHIVSRGQLVPAAKAFPLPTPIQYYEGAYAGRIALLRQDNATATFESMYRNQPYLYAVINKRMNAIARLPIHTYQLGENDSRERINSHPLARLLRRPAPRMSEWQFKAAISRALDVHGHSVWLKVREAGPGSPTKELWPVPWQNITVVKDDSGPIEYRVRVSGIEYIMSPEEVLHIELPEGISPMEPLRRTLALEDAATTWQSESLRNGVTPRGAFVTEQRLTDAAMPRLREELNKLYTGAENAGRFAILEGGMKFEKIGQSAVDVDLINQRKLSREEVCAVYDTHPALIGIAEVPGLVNTEARRNLYDSIASRIALIEESFNIQVVADVPAWDGIFAEFDPREMLRLDPEAQARADLIDQQSSTTTINERRRMRNQPPILDPIADAVMVPVNMMPVGEGVDATFPALGSTTAGTPEQGQTTPQAMALTFVTNADQDKA